MQIALNRGTAGAGLPFEHFVALAEAAGFEAADPDLSFAETRSADALGELFAAHHLGFGGWSPPVDFRQEPAKQPEGLKRLDAQARAAKALGIDSCATWIMPSSELPFMDNWKFHVERIKPVAAALAHHGLRFGLEFVAPYHLRRKFPHEFISSMGMMLELAAECGPSVGLLVDIFHLAAGAMPLDHLAQIPGNRIVLAHLNDAPPVPSNQMVDGERLLPGEGALDIPGFMSALNSAGYDGPVSVEVFSESLRKLPPEVAAKKAWAATARALGR